MMPGWYNRNDIRFLTIISLDIFLPAINKEVMKSLRGKPPSIMFLSFNSLLSQQAAGNLTQERLK